MEVIITIKPADLIFVRGNGPIDHAIESISHSSYNHVAGLVKPNELFEAQALRNVGYQALDVYKGDADIYTCDELTDEQRQQIVQYVLDHQGEHYGYKLIAWEFAHFVFHVDLPMKDKDEPDCSYLWQEAYRSVGVDLCPGLEYAAPGDLAESKLLRKVGEL